MDVFTWIFWFECHSIPLMDEETRVCISFLHSQIYFDESFSCERPEHPCLLDDAYPSSGWTWDSHPCHLSFIDFIFYSYVHWEHENLHGILERLVWIQPHLGDMYFMMENLSMFRASLEGDTLLCHLHDPVIIHNVISNLLLSLIVPFVVMVSSLC